MNKGKSKNKNKVKNNSSKNTNKELNGVKTCQESMTMDTPPCAEPLVSSTEPSNDSSTEPSNDSSSCAEPLVSSIEPSNDSSSCAEPLVSSIEPSNDSPSCAEPLVSSIEPSNDSSSCAEPLVSSIEPSNDFLSCAEPLVSSTELSNDSPSCSEPLVSSTEPSNDSPPCPEPLVSSTELSNDSPSCSEPLISSIEPSNDFFSCAEPLVSSTELSNDSPSCSEPLISSIEPSNDSPSCGEPLVSSIEPSNDSSSCIEQFISSAETLISSTEPSNDSPSCTEPLISSTEPSNDSLPCAEPSNDFISCDEPLISSTEQTNDSPSCAGTMIFSVNTPLPSIPPNEANKIRLHIFAVPHTITNGQEFSSCAFTGKIFRFARMMQSRGFEVFHYGVEGSQTHADKNIDVLTHTEWNNLRIQSLRLSGSRMNATSAINFLKNKNNLVGTLGNLSLPLYKVFNRKLSQLLKRFYRSTETDIVCLPYGQAHEEAIKGGKYTTIESGIGYRNSYKTNRIFESYAWMHITIEKQQTPQQPFWYVIPNYYDTDEFPLSLTPKRQFGFLGRIVNGKGCAIFAEIAKKFPDIDFILCGQGDPKPFLKSPNVIYKEAIEGNERAEYLGSLVALIAPSNYLEPFCGVTVEAQLCGTPVITVDYGGVVETVEQWKTGVRCRLLDDYCVAVEKALDGYFDRSYIHQRAVKTYGMFEIAKEYEKVFKTILQNKDWYTTKSSFRV